jgi:hypothetical protein
MMKNTKNALSQNVEKGATGIHYFMGDDIAEVTTADKDLMARIRNAAKRNKDIVIDQEPSIDNGGFMLALVPVNLFIPEQKEKAKRNYTPEQRKKRSEQMRKINDKRKADKNKTLTN